MPQLKSRAKIGFGLLILALVFFGISQIIEISFPVTILGSEGHFRIFFVIGAIFLLPAFYLLTEPSNQPGENRGRRTFSIFE